MAFDTAATRRTLLGSTPMALALLGGFANRARAAETSPLEAANIKVVNAFLDATRPKAFSEALAYLSPDCVYRMTETTPPAKGHAAITEQLRGFVDNANKITFEIYATQALGPIVINHRLDTFRSATHPLLFEGVGMFFLKNGRIVEWTDYTIRAALANEWPKPRA